MDEEIKTILVVDDSRTSRLIIRSVILQTHPNWVVLEAGNGMDAMEIVERDTPNCITMDVNMPGIDGLETSEKILMKYPGTRIVVFTSNLQDSTRQKAREMGMHFVAKPVTEQSIFQALSAFSS